MRPPCQVDRVYIQRDNTTSLRGSLSKLRGSVCFDPRPDPVNTGVGSEERKSVARSFAERAFLFHERRDRMLQNTRFRAEGSRASGLPGELCRSRDVRSFLYCGCFMPQHPFHE